MAKMSRLPPSRLRPLLDYLEGMTVSGRIKPGRLGVDELGVVAQQFLPTDSKKSSPSSAATSFAFEVN